MATEELPSVAMAQTLREIASDKDKGAIMKREFRGKRYRARIIANFFRVSFSENMQHNFIATSRNMCTMTGRNLF